MFLFVWLLHLVSENGDKNDGTRLMLVTPMCVHCLRIYVSNSRKASHTPSQHIHIYIYTKSHEIANVTKTKNSETKIKHIVEDTIRNY